MSNLPIVTYQQLVYSAKIMAHERRGYGMSDGTMAVKVIIVGPYDNDIRVSYDLLPTDGHAIAEWLGY